MEEIVLKIKHLLIECFCDYDSKDKNSICFTGNKINIDCLKHNCVHFMYTKCPNEIAYANEEGVVEKETDFIGFGDEMEKENVKDKKILINKSVFSNLFLSPSFTLLSIKAIILLYNFFIRIFAA